MEIEIKQGIPKHNFFVVAVPKVTFEEPLVPGQTKVKMVNPSTNEITDAVYVAHWDKMDEKEFSIANSFCILAYGCSPRFIVPKLLDQYPDLKENFSVQYWLLKKN